MAVVLLRVPHAAPVHPVPDRVQVTAVLDALVTVAVNCCVPPAWTVAVGGATATVVAGGGGAPPLLQPEIIPRARKETSSSFFMAPPSPRAMAVGDTCVLLRSKSEFS